MSLVPKDKQGKISFFQSKITPWTASATQIGTTSTAVTALGTLTTTAATKMAAQTAAEAAWKSSILAADTAIDAMCVAGANIIADIRAEGRTGGALVYELAEIPAPATPGPVGKPGTPFKVEARLKPNGSLELIFKCSNPAGCTGVIYQIYRKIESTGAYEYLGGSGERKFTDLTLPSGVPSVMYQIQATRSTSVGDEAEFVVNFGTTGATVTAVAKATQKAANVAA
jgi:hypothetical protein